MISRTHNQKIPLIKQVGKYFAWLLLGAVVTACGNENVSDLDNYVNEVKARKKSPIPPLPEVKQFETYTYDETKVRDPFIPTKRKVAQAPDSGIRPDDTRKREILEQFPLDTLTMVGSIEQNGQRWALIKTQDGTLYRTAPGKYMGQDNGKITRVTETEVVLQEIVPDGLGGWVKRQATLTVSE